MQDRDFLQKKVILRAMHLLEHQDRTEKGLRDKLKQSDYPEEMIEKAIAYVKSYGYIDDERYAQNYIRCRIHSKSRRQIWNELCRKGVEKGTIQKAWEAAAEEEQPDENKLIRDLIHKKCGENRSLDEKQFRRLQGYLARRGFSWEKISVALEEEHIKLCR